MSENQGIVYVVDDDRSVRLSLGALLRAHGFATRAFDSAEAFLEEFDRDAGGCLLVDVRMPGMSGLALQRKLAEEFAGFPVIVVTGHGDIAMAVEAMRAGAVDFLEKPCPDEILVTALRRALAAGAESEAQAADPAVAERLERLTPREREVLDHLVLGEINKVIAHKLKISQRTVEIHRARIKEKLEAQSLSDLIRMML